VLKDVLFMNIILQR